jgi:hypothetical protein
MGEFVEYIGCRIERSLKDRWMKLTLPVLIQSSTYQRRDRHYQQRQARCCQVRTVDPLTTMPAQYIEAELVRSFT